MKRKISFLLALTMLIMAIPFSSFAQSNYDKQLKEAIVKSKELFNISSEYDKFDHRVTTYDGNTIFHLTWSDSNEKLGSIDVSVMLDGTVTSYSKWKPIRDEQKPQLAKVSKEEGLSIAKDFIKNASPKLANNIKYIETSEPLNVHYNEHNYYFVRVENDIPYYNNNINISVDNSTGEVKNYYASWDMNLVFPDAKDIISLEKAQELYKQKIGLKLLYKSTYDGDKDKIYLVYSMLNMDLGIDAKDGEVVNLNDYFRLYEKSMDMGGSGAAPQELSPDEKKAVEGIEGLISQKEAEKIARDILKLDSKYGLEYASLNKYTRDENYVWQMDFTRDGKHKGEYYANISINAKTKELISFYNYAPVDTNKKIQYNKEQALDIAKKYIDKISPHKAKLIELNEKPSGPRPLEGERSYRFEFVRKLDNAYVERDGISVVVDTIEGKIREYRINWNKGEFPPKDKVISIDKAYNILFNDIGMELKYINPYEPDRSSKDSKKLILAYGLKSEKPANIDANTGTILNYRGEPFKEAVVTNYNDIDKSYAKDKINILAQYGIAFPEKEFKPSEKINQRDFLYLLVKAQAPHYQMDNPKDALYNYAINNRIIKEEEKAPEQIVTKEEAIKYIIRALKYDKVADLSEIYKDLFKDTKDIDPKLKGYVSIAYGLGIVEGYNGNLSPKAELKREDAASIIYNYLFNGK